MNRSIMFNSIEYRLSILAVRIKIRGRLNILDLHLHSENFYKDFLNLLFNWNLFNENVFRQNVEAIDLRDEQNKILVQVSSSATKSKIESTLSKEILADFSDYHIYFVFPVEDASELRNKTYKNPYGLTFIPSTDIIDITFLLRIISSIEIGKLEVIYKFINDELDPHINEPKLPSDLHRLILLLSKINLEETYPLGKINSFEIERKINFNDLVKLTGIINDYKIYGPSLNRIYRDFDEMGENKSFSVLQVIKKEYTLSKIQHGENNVDIFMDVIDRIKVTIHNEMEVAEYTKEELDVYVSIIVVDAFIRCKIFDNPEEYKYANT